VSLLFQHTRGKSLGIAHNLAFAEREVYTDTFGSGIIGEGEPPAGTCVIPETWYGKLAGSLTAPEGSLELSDFGKRAGLLMGNPPSDARRIGVLVWYRRGIPIPHCHLVLQDERCLAGDWGARVAPSALVVPVRAPGKAWGLTHKRLAPHFQAARITGPVLAWHWLGREGPVLSHIELDLGGLPIHAFLQTLEVDLVDFLRHIYALDDLAPPFCHEQCAAAIRVSVPPWPSWDEYGRCPEVQVPPERWVWPIDVRRSDAGILYVAGRNFAVADVTASHLAPDAAIGDAHSRTRAIDVEDAQVRCDALYWAPHYVQKLDRRGYLK
jgi:hypothetical protein